VPLRRSCLALRPCTVHRSNDSTVTWQAVAHQAVSPISYRDRGTYQLKTRAEWSPFTDNSLILKVHPLIHTPDAASPTPIQANSGFLATLQLNFEPTLAEVVAGAWSISRQHEQRWCRPAAERCTCGAAPSALCLPALLAPATGDLWSSTFPCTWQHQQRGATPEASSKVARQHAKLAPRARPPGGTAQSRAACAVHAHLLPLCTKGPDGAAAQGEHPSRCTRAHVCQPALALCVCAGVVSWSGPHPFCHTLTTHILKVF
jgi:hypothetical protein